MAYRYPLKDAVTTGVDWKTGRIVETHEPEGGDVKSEEALDIPEMGATPSLWDSGRRSSHALFSVLSFTVLVLK